MDDIQMLEYSAEDRTSCIDLLKKTFVGTSDENTFNWRFESHARPAPLLVCAKHNGKIVSFLSWIPWEFEYDGDRFLGYQAGELATDINYRGKGLASRLFNFGNEIAINRNIDFLFSFPKYMSFSAFAHYKAKYFSIGNFYTHIKVINPFKKKTYINTDKNNDLFQHVIKDKNKITPVFDSDYLNWRYLNNPNKYDIISYDENNNRAIFILRKRKHISSILKFTINFVILVDCQFSSYDEIFIANALQYLENEYSRNSLFFMTFFNPNTDRGRLLVKYFNIKIKSKFEMLCIKILNKNLEYYTVCNFNNWDILPHVKDVY